MIDVVFDDSTKGSMKVAKNYEKNRMTVKATTGSSQDIVYIGFSLDAGDITGEIDSEGRQNIFREVWGSVDFSEEEREEFFNMQREDLEKLISNATQGIPIRIWKSNAPFSACGFAFVCDILKAIDCKISVVSLPEYRETSDNTIQSYSHWGEISPGQFYDFLPFERELTTIEKCMHSDHWQDLKAEHAPLRAVVNGNLISVPEDFYDHIIINNIPDGEFVMARLIGEILCRYPLGVSDGWYALRIKKMIDENKLEVVSYKDHSHPYGKILRKVT